MTENNLDDFQKAFGIAISEAVRDGRVTLGNVWNESLGVVFPHTKGLDDLVGYAKTLEGDDVLVEYGYGSLDNIFVEQKKGIKSAVALSGFRALFNRAAEHIDAKVRLYALAMPQRGCDISGALVTSFEVYNLWVDLTTMPKPTVDVQNSDISKPDFLYLNGANLAFVDWGHSEPGDTISTTFNYLNRGFSNLKQLQEKAYKQPTSPHIHDNQRT
jgi:hypothetical protein